MGKRTAVAAGLLSAVASAVLPSVAWAHPTFEGSASVPANSDQKLTFHVPEEKGSGVHNTKVVFVLPADFANARCEAKPQWHCAVSSASNGRTAVSYTRTAGNAADERFAFSVRTPGNPGDYPIPTNQSYSDNSTVRWAGPPNSDTPAPVLTVT
jgi:uncharacterized protein YcnI